MPFIVPFIPLITAAVAAAGVADTVYNQVNQPSTPTVPTTPTAPTPQGTTTDTAQKTAVANTLPTLQSLTGGSVSPEYAAQWAGQNTGLSDNPQAGGNIQSAINQFFGLGAPSQTGLSTTGAGSTPGNSITDLLARVTAPGGGGGSIVDAALSSDTFHGFGG